MSIVVSEDFNGSVSGWSNNSTSTVDGEKILGRFIHTQDVEKTFTVPTNVDGYTISFDFYEIDSWDNEEFAVFIDGKEVNLGRFTGGGNDDSENARSGVTADEIVWTYSSLDPAQLSGTGGWADQIHQVSIWVPKTAISGNQITVKFDARTNQHVNDESYGIDNFAITADTVAPPAPARDGLVEIVRETFENGASGWSNTATQSLTGVGQVLGRFSGSQDVEKTFDVPVGVEGYNISFDFLELDSWDNEDFFVYVDGKAVDLGSFHFTSNEEDNARSGVTADGIEWDYTSDTRKQIGGTSGPARWTDQIHHVNLWVPREAVTGNQMTVKFDARTNFEITDESYAIDNFVIAAQPAEPDGIAYEDFNAGASGWSINSTHEIGGLGTVLGRFSGAQDVEKTFTVPAGADGVKIKFDFIEVDSWNDEAFYVYVDGKEVNLGNFTHSSDESENTKSGTTADGIEWRYTSGELSNRSGTSRWNEQVHDVELWVPRSAIVGSAVTLKFDARTDQSKENESYAIDNVQVVATGGEHSSSELILKEDFENGFSSAITDPVSTLGQSFGRFSGSQDRTFQYNLGEYDLEEGIQVWFRFVEMDSWNDENFTVRINGEDVSLGTYNWRTDGAFRSGSNGEGMTYTVVGRPSIAQGGSSRYNDETHDVQIQIAPGVLSGNKLSLEFDATLNSGLNNESYAIDDLEIRSGTNGLTKPYHEVLFDDDFNSSNDLWDQTSRTSLLGGGDFQLGEFFSNGNASKTFTFDTVGTDGVTIKFDMYEMNDWAQDVLIVKLNGQNVIVGDYSSTVDEGQRRGISGGVNWETKSLTSPANIDSGIGSAQLDQIHQVTLWVPRDMILDGGGKLEVILDPQTGSGDSFAIDNFQIVDGFEGFISDFSDGFVNRGSTLNDGERLYRGEALVSENGDTALFVDQDGGVWVMHDEDGSGRLESASALFASRLSYTATLDYITLQGNGNLTGWTANGTVIAETGTASGGTHVGHKIRVDNGEVITEEADGSGIYVADHEGSHRLIADAAVPVLLDYDRHVIDAGGWSKTTSDTDTDWLAGIRKDPTIEDRTGNFILQTDTDNVTKLVKLDLIDEDKPVEFVFNIFESTDSATEDVTISIGDLSNQWGSATPEKHRLEIGIGQLTPRTFDPHAGTSDAGKVDVVIANGQLAGEYEVTIRVNELDFLPATGNYGVDPLGGPKIDVNRWQKVHVDLGDNSGNTGLGVFKVQQYQPSESAPADFADFLKAFNLTTLPRFSVDADSVALSNDLSQTLNQLGTAVQNIYDEADFNNIAAFDWDIANGGKKNAVAVYNRVNMAMEYLSGTVGGSVSSKASLNDYVELLWDEVDIKTASQISTSQILKDIGFGIALVSTFGSLAVALAPALLEEAEVAEGIDVATTVGGDEFFDTFATEQELQNAETMGSKKFFETDGFKKWQPVVTAGLNFAGSTAMIATANYLSRNPEAFDGSAFNPDTFNSINGVDLSTAFGHIVNGLVYSALESGDADLIDLAEQLEGNYSNLVQAVSEYQANMIALAFSVDSLGLQKGTFNYHIREADEIMSIQEEEGFWKSLGLTVNRSAQFTEVSMEGDRFYYTKFTLSSGETELADNVNSFSYRGYHDQYQSGDDLGDVDIARILDFDVDLA